MTERATVYQALQIGPEGTAGTADDADILVQSFTIDPAIKHDVKLFKPTGQKFNTLAMPGKEWTEAKISGYQDYNELLYLLSSCLLLDTPAQQGATTAYKWEMGPSYDEADTIETLTVQRGNSGDAEEFAYGTVTDLTFTYTRDECALSGTMIGTAIDLTGTMTSTPASLAIVPVLPKDVCVYVGDTFATISATALQRVLKAEVSISGRHAPLWALLCTAGSWVGTIETAPTIQMKLLMEADAEGVALLTQMRAGSAKFVRIQAVSDTLAGTGYYYTLTHEMAGFVSNVSEFRDEDGVYALEWTLDAKYDATWGYAYMASLINKVSAL